MSKSLSESIKAKAIEIGYSLCGIADISLFKDFNKYIDKRVNEFPESAHFYSWLYEYANLPEKWKSVIVCVRKYNHYRVPEHLKDMIGKVYLFDGRLDCSKEREAERQFDDYLLSLGMLFEKEAVSARWAAFHTGLGFFGRNNFIYTKFGSYVWVDTWTVDVELDYDTNDDKTGIKHLCNDNCRKCIDACPTKALSNDFSMDMGKCVARLSFSNDENLKYDHLREGMGTWMYGCDICQDVCPMNINKMEETEDFPDINTLEISLEKIYNMDEDYFLNFLQPRFWYIRNNSIWQWKCNALRAMANSGDKKYLELIQNACDNKDERIKRTALWACQQLQKGNS